MFSNTRSSLVLTGVLCAAALLVEALPGQDEPPKPWRPPVDLQKAEARAQVHNKRVLAVLAARDEDLVAALKANRTLSRKLLYEFETVALAGAAAESCAKEWRLDDARPALVVLAADGDVRARFGPSDFMKDDELAGQALLAKLEPHFCPPVDAEKKLADGIAAAKRTGRFVFVRFDAPW